MKRRKKGRGLSRKEKSKGDKRKRGRRPPKQGGGGRHSIDSSTFSHTPLNPPSTAGLPREKSR